MHLIDTHFHLDLFSNPKKVLQNLEEKKIYSIAVTNLPDLFNNCFELVKDSKYVRAALGYHPELAGTYSDKLSIFKEHIKKTRYVGEIGLDFSSHYDESNKNKQVLIFEEIINTCRQERNKILTIHSRKSEKKVLEIIDNNFPGVVILHWFSGTITEAKSALDNNYYFSFNISMLKTKKGRELLNFIPKNRILTETDSPFTTSIDNFNSYQDLEKINIQIDSIFKIDRLNSKENVYENFKRILSTF